MSAVQNTWDIVSIGGLVIALIHAIFYNIRRSRCSDINCCCFKCKRQLMSPEEQKEDERVEMNAV